MTVLPERLVPELRAQLARLKGLWKTDLAANVPGVWLPEGLAKKYPKAGVSWEWQWVFPSRELGVDPATGIRRRHHVSDSLFQRALQQAAAKAAMTKRVTPHVLRHCDLRSPLRSAPGPGLNANRGPTISARSRSVLRHAPAGGGADIRTVQELLGHASVETTQIYTHVMHPASPRLRRAGKPGPGVRSPFDSLRVGPLDA